MHLLVPFAADDCEDCRNALRGLPLPNLERLLALLAAAGRDDGDATSLSPPHERALAAAWGWQGGDGLLPFAAHAAAADGVATAALAWALLTPSHWQLGRDDVTLLDPALLALDEAESRALFATAAELFTSEGFAVAWGSAERWYVARDDLQGIATASLDRVIGQRVDRWLRANDRSDDGARRAAYALVRRLQSEVQLAFYVHDVNERREERGELVVNSFWLSGCGWSQPADDAAGPQIASSLRAPLLDGDWAAWAAAWRALDAGAIARLLADGRAGKATALTLCGARAAARFELQPRTLWQRLWAPRAAAHDVLVSL
jgi:hypothetical protein